MWSQIVTFLLTLVFTSYASTDWCYQSQVTEGSTCKGPAAWKDVNVVCNGKRQSPVDIETNKVVTVHNRNAFWFTGYKELFTSTVKNNGQSGVVIKIPDGATVRGGNLNEVYKAVQIHLRWGSQNSSGSEHTINGVQYPMELHIVHMKDKYITLDETLDDPSGLAVLGFFYKESSNPNENYKSFIEALAKVQEANSEAQLNVSLNSLLPTLGYYYRYEGSLTTPGCAESVIWTVFEDSIPLSKDQLAAFFNLKFSDGKPMVGTFRPVQPLNGRTVYRSHSSRASGLDSFTLLLCMSWAYSLVNQIIRGDQYDFLILL